MWFDTLVLQLRLHMAYRVNGILYRLRFLSLSYESGFAKTLGLVLAILRELLGLLLGKLLYMAAFFAAPLLLFPSEPPAGLYGHLLLFLTLIGGIFNSKLLDAEQDVYYAVFLLRMDARRYALSAYGYTLLKDFMGFLTAALVVGRLALQAPLALCLLTPVLVCSVKLTAAGLELAHFTRRRRLAREAKWFPVLQGLGLLLLAAGGLYAYNRCEDAHAGAEAQTVVVDLQQKVETPEPEAESGPLAPELPVVEIDGNEYVGEISIPAIGIDLPVMSEWSYPRLKIAPSRQFGSSRTDDLVIAAHNYESHFGKLTSLTAGDSVTFTDMDGIVNEYVVNKVEVLDPHSVEEVEHSGYALVLYTCTYGGKTRVTVFCDRAS